MIVLNVFINVFINHFLRLLAVSDAQLPVAVRSGIGPAATIGIEGELRTHGAVALDAPGAVTIGGSVNASGASWSLASSSRLRSGHRTRVADVYERNELLPEHKAALERGSARAWAGIGTARQRRHHAHS